jgi:hypothetical protein
MMNISAKTALAILLAFTVSPTRAEVQGDDKDRTVFEQATAANWQEVFADDGTGSWKEKWFLDGEVGTVTNSPEGMTLTAGPESKNDAHHMVLWTKQEFAGDLKIEYDFTRTDKASQFVTIIYIQATGSGKGQFAKDITKWNELRKVPAMSTYYDNMHTYHLSYAAFGESKQDKTSYIRGRRYMPHAKGLKGTELTPDYHFDTLFATGVKHHITIIKRDRDLHVRVQNPDEVRYCHLQNAKLPVITEGRIGLRHMFTRSARYANFRVSNLDAGNAEPQTKVNP